MTHAKRPLEAPAHPVRRFDQAVATTRAADTGTASLIDCEHPGDFAGTADDFLYPGHPAADVALADAGPEPPIEALDLALGLALDGDPNGPVAIDFGEEF